MNVTIERAIYCQSHVCNLADCNFDQPVYVLRLWPCSSTDPHESFTRTYQTAFTDAFALSFDFRTISQSGTLIQLLAGRDFVAVYLLKGQVVASYDLGGGTNSQLYPTQTIQQTHMPRFYSTRACIWLPLARILTVLYEVGRHCKFLSLHVATASSF